MLSLPGRGRGNWQDRRVWLDCAVRRVRVRLTEVREVAAPAFGILLRHEAGVLAVLGGVVAFKVARAEEFGRF